MPQKDPFIHRTASNGVRARSSFWYHIVDVPASSDTEEPLIVMQSRFAHPLEGVTGSKGTGDNWKHMNLTYNGNGWKGIYSRSNKSYTPSLEEVAAIEAITEFHNEDIRTKRSHRVEIYIIQA